MHLPHIRDFASILIPEKCNYEGNIPSNQELINLSNQGNLFKSKSNKLNLFLFLLSLLFLQENAMLANCINTSNKSFDYQMFIIIDWEGRYFSINCEPDPQVH